MKKLLPLLPILVFITVFIAACTKIVTTDIGGDLIPTIDGVNTKEMYLSVVSKNWKDTVVKVGIGTPNVLGYVNDPLFGKTAASINVELKPGSFPLTFPSGKDSMYIDSVVLVLGYSGVWGDTLTHLKLGVYQLSQDDPPFISSDTLYATNQYITKGRELTLNNVPADIDITKLNDSIYPFREAAINQLRIKLNPSFGDELLKNYDTTATGAYHSDSLFERYFKGFQITPEENAGNALLRINLLDTNTKLAIYYRYDRRDSVGKKDTTVTYFRTNSYTTGSSNYITHDRSGTSIPSFLASSNTNDSLLFIDANPGIYARVTTDSLAYVSNKIIHRAELIIEQVPDVLHPGVDALFTPPNLFITPYSTDSMRRFALPYDVVIANGVFSNPVSFGCVPSKKTDPETQQTYYVYNFDISRYVQGILTRQDKIYPLILYAPSNDYILPTETASPLYSVYTGSTAGPLNTPAIGRVRVGGGNNSAHRMRIHIVYSDVK